MTNTPRVNPTIVMREEYDDWAILFDPDTGETNGLSPTGVFIWKQLDGSKSKSDILAALNDACDGDVPEEAEAHFDEFVASLQEKGYLSI